MRYMVAHLYGDEALLFSIPMKRENADFTPDTIRRVLEERFPGKGIASPMEKIKLHTLISVYVAPNAQGIGRIDHNFQYWGLYDKETR